MLSKFPFNHVCKRFPVPGDPQDVKVTPVNSTTIHVTWKPPAEKDRHGIIRGYHVHVQEIKEEVRNPKRNYKSL